MKKFLIFLTGVVVGAAAGTIATVLCYQKEKQKWVDENNKLKETYKQATPEEAVEIEDEKELQDFYIQQLNDLGFKCKVSVGYDGSMDTVFENDEKAIEFCINKLQELGCSVIDESKEERAYEYYLDAKAKAEVNPLEEEEDDEYNETEDFTPIEVNPIPYEISSREHGQNEFYTCETIIWYKKDQTMTDDNYEILDNWQIYIGNVEDKLDNCTGDSLYFRNESQQTDYEVLIYDDSYKHAVEGEDELGDMAD